MTSPNNQSQSDERTQTHQISQSAEEMTDVLQSTDNVTDAAMPRFAPPAVEGEIGRLGKYRIQKELGRGGMGAVYLAFDERLQRKVALKVMLPKAAANPTAKDRFLREARAAAQISSDYVVNIYEADEIDGIPYISLQFLQGSPLDEYLKKKASLTIPQIIRIARETALGLSAAHSLGLVHRDIKPANIWLEAPTGRVKVLDFGLAKPVNGNDTAEITLSGVIMGTPAYMAPEQGLGQPVDGRADLFSLGCLLYRLVTGKLPFEGPTLMAILTALATEEPKPVRQLNPESPEPLANLIHRLMAKKPDARPASAKAVADELARITNPPKPAVAAPATAVQAPVVYVPMAINEPQNPFSDIDVTEEVDKQHVATETANPPKKPQKFQAMLVGGLFVGLLAIIVGGYTIIKITNKDGSVTKLKVPDNAKIEINGKEVNNKEIKPVPVKPPLATNDADRIITEWAFSNGGQLTIRIGETQKLINPTVTRRIPEESFELVGVELGKSLANDESAARFDGLKNLEMLSIVGGTLSDQGIAKLRHLPRLNYLNLHGANLTNACLPGLKELPELAKLILINCNLTDTGIAELKALAKLKFLNLMGTPITDVGLTHLQQIAGLKELDLRLTKVSEAGVKKLATALPQCKIEWDGGVINPYGGTDADRKAAEWLLSRDADFGYSNSTGFHLVMKGKKHELPPGEIMLNSFNLKSTVDNDLAQFRGLKHLSTVVLIASDITDIGCEHLSTLPTLQKLFVTDTKITDIGLKQLCQARQMDTLHVSGTKITDNGLQHLAELNLLKELTVVKTGVSEKGVKTLSTKLPKCKIEWDGGVIEPSVGTDADRKAAEWVLSVGGTVYVNYILTDVNNAANLPKDPFRLTQFNLNGSQVTDKDLNMFSNCINLTNVYLSNTKITDAGLAHLINCKSLNVLYLNGTQITDAGLVYFKDCKNLKNINLCVTQIGDAGLIHLKGCDKLIHLDLQLTKVTDAGLSHFNNCKLLTNLYLSGTQVTDAGLSHFRDFNRLSYLELGNTKVSDIGLAVFKDCNNLTRLSLESTKLTDVSLSHFRNCNNLSYLNLSGTSVTDAGIAQIKAFKNLTHLVLHKTKVTAKGIDELKIALPKCKIEWDGSTIEPR